MAANTGISYGATEALRGTGVFAVVIVLSGFPPAQHAARYDLDLVIRGWR